MRDPVNAASDGGEPGSSGRIPFSQQAWTLDTLKVHFDMRIDNDRRYFSDLLSVQEQTNRDRFTSAEKAVYAALAANEKQVSAAMAASKEAIGKAESAAEARFRSLNELRAAMMDQQQTFAPKDGTDRQFTGMADRLTETKEGLTARLDAIEKKQDAMINKVLGFGVLVTFIVAMIAIFGGLVGPPVG